MQIKWMVATVPPDRRADFSAAQEAWAPIGLCEGFFGQVGGWDQDGRACVLAVWRDALAVERFMAHAHDAVTSASRQEETYSHLAVTHGSVLIRMPGSAPDLTAALGGAGLLRVADCTIHPARRDAFVGAQLRVWAPGMASCTGMLGGAFSSLGPERYLVTTAWSDVAAHESYLAGPFARLRAAAGASADLAALQGHRVRLEPRWTVRPR